MNLSELLIIYFYINSKIHSSFSQFDQESQMKFMSLTSFNLTFIEKVEREIETSLSRNPNEFSIARVVICAPLALRSSMLEIFENILFV